MKTCFAIIIEAKVSAAKEIFRSFGKPIDQMADILTGEELVKAFDWIQTRASAGDDVHDNELIFLEYTKASCNEGLISPETRQKLVLS